MALGDVHNMTAAGTICGVPFAITLGYQQVEPDDVGIDPGKSLVDGWFVDALGPFRTLRPGLCDDLIFECASVAYGGGKVTTVFLNGATGLSASAATPSPLAVQINTPPEVPHPGRDGGRFFMPGLIWVNTLGMAYASAFDTLLRSFCTALINIDSNNVTTNVGRFRLMPHAQFQNAAGNQDSDIFADVPYFSIFIKRLIDRTSDECSAFVAGSTLQGVEESTVPPEDPT